MVLAILPWIALAAEPLQCGGNGVDPSLKAFLDAEWGSYLAGFVQGDGRVIDQAAGGISTSEGQAYGMLRAVWVGDQDSYYRIYTWALNNLQRANPAALPAWRWGQAQDGSWGILDANAAADADLLMAWSMVLAYERWGDALWLERARLLAGAVWDREVVRIGGNKGLLTLLAGPWAQGASEVKLNPSYWMPFVFRTLAWLDPTRPWNSLVDSSYVWLARLRGPAGLPPDWAMVDLATGKQVPIPEPARATGDAASRLASDFSFDAFRLVWILAAEVRWYQEPRAAAELKRYRPLWQAWQVDRHLPEAFTQEGTIRSGRSYAGMYGAVLPALSLVTEAASGDACSGEDTKLYLELLRMRQETGAWGFPGDYYAPNWVWFGVALWSGLATPPSNGVAAISTGGTQ